ncbi:PqqD family protein [Pseudomonas sp. LRF_L74]|uniref:PqqD family protein n=1 Tax=Pseudomonas sp. LRF_L74 TaxID=3369422 RepID=UPI003F61A193
MISLHSKIARVSDPIATEIDGKVVLLGVESDKYFAFDAISSDIWSRIDTYPVVADLCDVLAHDYDAALDIIQADVCHLVSVLMEHRLVSIVETSGSNHDTP